MHLHDTEQPQFAVYAGPLLRVHGRLCTITPDQTSATPGIVLGTAGGRGHPTSDHCPSGTSLVRNGGSEQ